MCVCVCVWARSLGLSALPSYYAPDKVIRAATGVARLHCLYLAGVSVCVCVCCQIIVAHVLPCSLLALLVPESCFRLLAVLISWRVRTDRSTITACAGDSSTAGFMLIFCDCCGVV